MLATECWDPFHEWLSHHGGRTGMDMAGGAKPERTRSERVKDDKLLLTSALFQHHRHESDAFNFEPMTQKELSARLGWSQSKVSRTMERVFGPKPMARYRRLCQDDKMKWLPEWLEDGTRRIDAAQYKPLHPTESEEREANNV